MVGMKRRALREQAKSKSAKPAKAEKVAKPDPKALKKGAPDGDGDDDEMGDVDMEDGDVDLDDVEDIGDDDAGDDDGEEAPTAKRKQGGEGKMKELLDSGREKGFVTFDEINEALPAEAVSPDQIDDVMSMFGEHDIKVVGSADVKATDGKSSDPILPIAKPEDEEPEKEEKHEEEDESVGKSNDPVRMYLRKMGSVSLLTREGEWRSPSASRKARRPCSTRSSSPRWRSRTSSSWATS